MELLLTGIGIGASAASVVWFLVCQNNKDKFMAALFEAEAKGAAIADVVKKTSQNREWMRRGNESHE